MRGELVAVWAETWREIWLPLAETEEAPGDIFCELFRELSPTLKRPPTVEQLADIIDSQFRSREAFEFSADLEFASEEKLASFFEAAFYVLEDLQGDELSNRYFNLLESFIEKFSLRYELRRPCVLCPTLSGVFSSLVRDLRSVATLDAHLLSLLNDFEESIRDLRHGITDGRIKTCLNKQFMFLEALGSAAPGVTASTLGDICSQLDTWPHRALSEAIKKLYGFASDYPGIRHGGSSPSKLREIELRDIIAISIALTGFTPYFSNQISADSVYSRK